MKRKWRGLVLGGVAIEVLVALTAPGCGSSAEKKRVPLPYPDAGASGESPGAAGASPSGGDSGAGGSGAVSGDSGSPSDGGAAGAPEVGGTGGTAGSGGAALTGCALGDPCCTGNLCEASLACLGVTCSCVADLSDSYMVRTDGIAFNTLINDQAQSVITNSDTGLPLRGIQHISGSLYHGCAALDSGQVRCWPITGGANGNGNNNGQLGNGTLAVPPSSLLATLVKVDATTNLSNVVHIGEDSMNYFAAAASCAATSDGFAYCWGQTGIVPGTTMPVPFATQIKTAAAGPALSGVTQVAVGQAHACALSNGKVRCWGPSGISTPDTYPATDITIPGTVLKIAAGFSVSYAFSANDGGSVYAWGNNNGGKFGTGDPAAVGYSSDTPVRVRVDANTFLSGVTDFVASYNGGCVIRTDHSLLCWGGGMNYATPMAVGGVVKTASNVAITDAAKLSAPNDSSTPRYVTMSGVEYSQGKVITPNCAVQE